MAAMTGFILYLLAGEGAFIPIAQYETKDACQTAVAVMDAAVGDRPREAHFACLEMQSLFDLLQKNGIDMN